MPKCLIAMSGGVDSSVAVRLMQEQGWDCLGAMMALHGEESPEDARRVAETLGIPFTLLDCRAQFRERVMEDFARSYEQGRTPNPCIVCNRYLKFGVLYDYAAAQGCEAVVTGHYARIEARDGRFLLKKAADPAKDQSYMLYALTQAQLAHIRLPLGALTKAEARAMAEESGLVTAHKSDSQDICFVPDGDYAGFLCRFCGKEWTPGDFVDLQGNVLGQHRGIIRYTVGQRRGLGIAAAHPLYVVRLDVENNRVVLGENSDLFSRELTAHGVNLIALPEIVGALRCKAKIRYRHTEQPCTVTQPDRDTLQVVFDEPQRAITPGQSVVLYDGDTVLGGGIIQ